jgi:hypothetical protein
LYALKNLNLLFLIRLRRANGQTGSTDAGLMHFGDSFYYGMHHNVKVANKRLLKTVGFAIRMPIPEAL